MIPLMPSPGRPKTVSTPQSASRSISASDAIFAIVFLSVPCAGAAGQRWLAFLAALRSVRAFAVVSVPSGRSR